MRLVVKLFLIVAIVLGMNYYYRLLDFNLGFVTSMQDNMSVVEVVGVKEIYTTNIVGDNYIVVLQTDKHGYITRANGDEVNAVKTAYGIFGVQTKTRSMVPCVICGVAALVILFFPKIKKRANR